MVDRIYNAYGITIFRTIIGNFIEYDYELFLTAYPLSKKILPGRSVFMQIFFFTMIFSGGMIPTYLVVKMFGLVDTIWALINTKSP